MNARLKTFSSISVENMMSWSARSRIEGSIDKQVEKHIWIFNIVVNVVCYG